MFDVGFSEMVVIAVVALIVLGPERLPKVARTMGVLFGRLQRYVSDVKADINREMELEELRKFKDQFQSAAESVEQTIHGESANTDSEVRQIGAAVADASALPKSQAATDTASVSQTLAESGVDAAGKTA